jgi:hypothetical protein
MELILRPEDIAYPKGLSIAVKGFQGDIGHETPSQVFLEVVGGKLRVHVWDGEEDPSARIEINPLELTLTPGSDNHPAPPEPEHTESQHNEHAWENEGGACK